MDLRQVDEISALEAIALGGNSLASLSYFEQRRCAKEEYDEYGVRVVHYSMCVEG